MDRILAPSLLALAHRQDGLLTRAQLLAHGATDGVIAANLRAERWRRYDAAVYATFTGELTATQRLWVAVLGAGRGAAISHRTAAHLHGLGPGQPDLVDITIPAERRVRARQGVALHRTRTDLRVSAGLPVVGVADTLCDLASLGVDADALTTAIARATANRLVEPQDVLRRIEERGSTLRGRRELYGLVADVMSGAHSALEVRYLRDVERAHGLPRAVRQQRVKRAGRTAIRDVVYTPFGVVVELDGRLGHDGFHERFRDLTRDLSAADSGEVTLRFGYWDVASSACTAARQVARLLTIRGWTGRTRRCRKCGASRER